MSTMTGNSGKYGYVVIADCAKQYNCTKHMSYVYLLHFTDRICRDRPAQHYLGFAQDVVKRVRDHRCGIRHYGAALTFAAYERGVPFLVARVWANVTKRDEKLLRDLHNNPRLCPLCNPTLQLITRINTRGKYQTYRIGDLKAARYGDIALLRERTLRPARQRTRRDGSLNYSDDDYIQAQQCDLTVAHHTDYDPPF